MDLSLMGALAERLGHLVSFLAKGPKWYICAWQLHVHLYDHTM